MDMRLCICQECQKLNTIEPHTGTLIAGQYVSEVVYKSHRQRQNARTAGTSYIGPILVNPPLFQHRNVTHASESKGSFSSAFSHTFSSSDTFPLAESALPNVNPSITATTTIYHDRLRAIEQKINQDNVPGLLDDARLVFINPPTQLSPPLLAPSEKLLLVETAVANAPLVHYERWLFSAKELLEVWRSLETDPSSKLWGAKLEERIQWEMHTIERGKMLQWEKLRKKMANLSRRVKVVNSGRRMAQDFAHWPSKLVLCYLVVAFMHLIANVSLKYTKFFLTALRWMQSGAVQGQGDIPRDVPATISRLQLKPSTKAFVCCPKCFTIYTYDPESQFPARSTCGYQRTLSSPPCGTQLHGRHKDPNKPVRLFLYHELDDWISGMYSRSDIEKILDQDILERPTPEAGIPDILKSPELRQFMGPEQDPQRPFLRRPGNEGRLVFSLNMDGFNPLMNKESGKKISVGAIYMVCLNLPPAIRYDLENVFLVGIIPGPHEPSKEEINHVLEPLVDDLLRLWHYGFYLTSTSAFPQGRLVRGAVIPLICDLPAARQMSGFASHTSRHFCSLCTLEAIDIDNFNYTSWPRRSEEEHRQLAEEWRSAPTEARRKELFDNSGIRWSQLLRLPYWDPTKYVMIDSMHGFFLRMFQRHCRNIWGMGVEILDSDYPSFAQDKSRPSDEDMEDGYHILRYGDETQLRKLKPVVLRELARLTETVPYGGRPKKLVRGLLNYRIQRGWFDEDDVVERSDEDKQATRRAFLGREELKPTSGKKQKGPKRNRGDPPTSEEIARGIAIVESGTKSAVKKLRKVLLMKICEDKGIDASNSDLLADLVQKLERWRLERGIVDASGNLLHKSPTKSKKKIWGVLGKETLQEITSDMQRLQLPSWMAAAPTRPGEAKAGKFTADQWRSFCIVNLTVTLNRLWGHEPESSRKRQMLDNFMHLVTAVKLATMRTMTTERIAGYVYHMHSYLTGLLALYPGTTISPYQHLALHFQDFLLRFGPVHAWRCFPFERYNYLLQKIPTNMRLGELESTLLEHFCQGQRLHLLFKPHQGALPEELNEILTELEEILETDIRGTRLGDTLAFNSSFELETDLDPVQEESIMPEAWYILLRTWAARSGWIGPSTLLSQFAGIRKRVKRLGEIFEIDEASTCNSRIYYRSATGEASAGVIKGIFSHRLGNTESAKTFFVVAPLKPLSTSQQSLDPYLRFPIVGGRLYGLTLGSEILISLDDLLYHFAYIRLDLPQIDAPCVLACPLDR